MVGYGVYAVGEVVGLSGTNSVNFNTVYLARFFNASYPSSPTFNDIDITNFPSFGALVEPYANLIKNTCWFYPSGIPDWGGQTSISQLVLPDSHPEADFIQGSYRYAPKGQRTRSFHFLATPVGTVTRATDYVVRDILNAEFVLDAGSIQYHVLAGFCWPVSIVETSREVGWLTWRSTAGVLAPEINRGWSGDAAQGCRLLAPQITTIDSDDLWS